MIRASGSGRSVRLRARRAGTSELVSEAELPSGPIVLVIRSHRDHYEFFWMTERSEARSLGTLPTTPLSTEAAGGFTGVFIGMYAKAGPEGPAAPADFDWFDYEARDEQ